MVTSQTCLIAAVDLNRHAAGVIRRAAKLAQFGGLHLIVVHVVEHETGFESDHAPFMTPTQLRTAMARDARAWLLGLLFHLNLPKTEIVVESGTLASVLADLVAERRARYLVTGRLKWGAVSKLANLAADPVVLEARCDVLHAGSDEIHWSGRLSRWAGRWLQGEGSRLP